MDKNQQWDLVIEPKKGLLDINLKQILEYRDLLLMLVKKDIVVVYKQTVLGPVWFFVQPIMTTLIYMFVFGRIANISTDGLPQPLFYMSGIILWNYFSECFVKTSDTFSSNAGIFGKVYYPRLINPISVIISNGIKFSIQLILFIALYLYFYFTGANITIGLELLFFPLLLILMAFLGLGFGLIFSSMTTKYKDLKFLIQFGVQLLMYATPIIYPLNSLDGKIKTLVQLNPITHIVELFKFSFFGQGSFSYLGLAYSIIFTLIVLFLGIIIFNKTEKTFMDTV
jgi:lipopolysaccharide transport system permease protein